MSEDVSEIISNQARAKVKRRKTRLTKTTQVNSPPATSQTPQTEESVEGDLPSTNQLAKLEAELKKIAHPLKRTTLQIEEPIRIELLNICNEYNITLETLLESLCTHLGENPQLIPGIAENARVRLKQRKHVGNLRRMITQLKRI